MFSRPVTISALVLIASCSYVAIGAETPEQLMGQQAKPDFEPIKLSVFPNSNDSGESNLRFVKPGHWTEAALATKANNFDFFGSLDANVKPAASGNAVDLPRTAYQLQIARPAVLPKGQPKRLVFPLFVPDDLSRAWLATELHGRGGGQQSTPDAEPLALMRPYQFFLVVLAGEPDRYRPLEMFDSVHAPHGGDALNYYRVVTPPLKKPLPLPAATLQWSSIAYIIWDDVDPQLLTEEQQHALVDWLYQGGQLIISGPKSLDQLGEKTFLHNYLPALAGDPLKIFAATLGPLNLRWTLPVNKQPGKPITPTNSWNGVKLVAQNGAQFVPGSGELIAEGRVGRGRIVVTAFRLSERELWDWPGFDGFVNGCLLLRPPRRFSTAGYLAQPAANWANESKSPTDPRWVSNVRYLSRDWNQRNGFTSPQSIESSEMDNSATSVGAWTDFSDVANTARDMLKVAAGIVIPKSGFVISALAVYLVVLVPLNWLVFWTIGRVEWAWIAAPVIALAGMAMMVKVAQLDIGFARSQTEIAVLEVHNNYPRGLLSRFTALYTSLSTNYDIHASNRDTLILPFSADQNFTLLPGQASQVVTFGNDPEVVLSGFTVPSNSTGMLHSEQMIDMSGAIAYSDDQSQPVILDNLPFTMKHVAVIRRTIQGEIQVARIDELQSGSRTELTFRPSLEQAITQKTNGTHLNLDKLADLVSCKENLQPGDVRLIGVIPQPLSGLTVDPTASQPPRGATLVVAFLKEPALPEPRPDVNTRRDVAPAREQP